MRKLLFVFSLAIIFLVSCSLSGLNRTYEIQIKNTSTESVTVKIFADKPVTRTIKAGATLKFSESSSSSELLGSTVTITPSGTYFSGKSARYNYKNGVIELVPDLSWIKIKADRDVTKAKYSYSGSSYEYSLRWTNDYTKKEGPNEIYAIRDVYIPVLFESDTNSMTIKVHYTLDGGEYDQSYTIDKRGVEVAVLLDTKSNTIAEEQ